MASENGKWTILIMGLLFKMSWTKVIQLGTTVRPGFQRDEGFYADLCYLQDQTYSGGTVLRRFYDVINAYECQQHCAEDHRCIVFVFIETYNPNWPTAPEGECMLKNVTDCVMAARVGRVTGPNKC